MLKIIQIYIVYIDIRATYKREKSLHCIFADKRIFVLYWFVRRIIIYLRMKIYWFDVSTILIFSVLQLVVYKPKIDFLILLSSQGSDNFYKQIKMLNDKSSYGIEFSCVRFLFFELCLYPFQLRRGHFSVVGTFETCKQSKKFPTKLMNECLQNAR